METGGQPPALGTPTAPGAVLDTVISSSLQNSMEASRIIKLKEA